jgi:hypothetical protein
MSWKHATRSPSPVCSISAPTGRPSTCCCPGGDETLGDVLLARTGKRLNVDTAFEQARVLSPQRVAEIAQKLAEVPRTLISERLHQLAEAKGKAPSAKGIASLEELFTKVVALYTEAAKSKQSMLSILV